MKSRSETATSEQVLQWFYDHPEGANMLKAYKILPGYVIPAGMLGKLHEIGALVAIPLPGPLEKIGIELNDPWNFLYRLSYEAWVQIAGLPPEQRRLHLSPNTYPKDEEELRHEGD